jgi:hypothetical protein
VNLSPLSQILTIKNEAETRLSYAIALRQPQQTLASFALTKAAEGSLARLSSALSRGRPAAFWLCGPRGVGKTHFLACLTTLLASGSAGVPEVSKGGARKFPALYVAIEVGDSARLLQAISEALWDKLDIPRHLTSLWRRLGGEVSLRATLEEVGRMGFSSTMIMVDLVSEHDLDAQRWRLLNDIATGSRAFKSPAFFIIAARGEPLDPAAKLTVAPSCAREIVAKTLSGFRGFAPSSESSLQRYYDLYASANSTGLNFQEFRQIFPFHERTIEVLETLTRDCQRDGVLAEIVKETLCANGSEPPLLRASRLVMPADLLRSSSARLRIRAACVDQSFENYELAPTRIGAMGLDPARSRLANDLVKTLFLASFATETRRRSLMPFELAQLAALNHRTAMDADSVSELLASMAAALDGIIVVANDGRARYQHAQRPDSGTRRWNDGLALLRLVEPGLTKVDDSAALEDQANRFRAALYNRRLQLSGLLAQLRQLAGVLGGSPRALAALNSFGDLLAAGDHEAFLERAAMLAGAKSPQALADEVARFQRLAERAPWLVEIKRYLGAVPTGSDPVGQIQMIRSQLLAGLDFRLLIARPESADSIAEHFKQFKARYRELYLAAHSRHRAESEQFLDKLRLQQFRFQAFARLNRIRELGSPIGTELERDLAMLMHNLVPCPESADPDLTLLPRCPTCEFSFDNSPPLAEIDEFEQRLTAALKAKLQALSDPNLIRVLTESDSRQRLGGLLHLLRQNATDEAIAALDEDTAGYLASLLIKTRQTAAVTRNERQAFPNLPAVREDNFRALVPVLTAKRHEDLFKTR